MTEWDKLKVPFRAPLQPGDTETTTAGCRANDPEICRFNGIADVCAFQREDGICHNPTRAWKKQYQKLLEQAGGTDP